MRWLIVTFLALMAAVSLAQIKNNNAIQFDVLRSGEQSQITKEQMIVIQTEGDFQNYWRAAMGNTDYPRGEINWAKQFLIAVNLGTRNTGGYKVFVQSIERARSAELEVTVVELVPSGQTAQVVTSPYEIVRVDRAPGKVTFNRVKRNAPSTGGNGGGNWNNCRWRTFMSETTGGGSHAREIAIYNPQDFKEYWRDCFGASSDCPADQVDWNNEMLVAIHLGSQSSTGYNVLVESVTPLNDGIGVSYIKQVPATGQRVTRTKTSPYVIIRLPRTQGRILFDSRTWSSEGR